MREVQVNRLGGLILPRKSMVRLTDRPDMTLDVYRGHQTTTQQQLKPSKGGYSYQAELISHLIWGLLLRNLLSQEEDSVLK